WSITYLSFYWLSGISGVFVGVGGMVGRVFSSFFLGPLGLTGMDLVYWVVDDIAGSQCAGGETRVLGSSMQGLGLWVSCSGMARPCFSPAFVGSCCWSSAVSGCFGLLFWLLSM
ncbi:uncharacterized protein BJ171DRAFT_529440, partial [Polychytrium aggregatum]|uniref:uncharacterized protein n=1 Tax=Polychytrium aggregatum TaxID=110093 RepID=UPI0022FE47A4